MNFLPEKKYGVPSHNFVKKNVLCEKGDVITRFDGTTSFKLLFASNYFIFVNLTDLLHHPGQEKHVSGSQHKTHCLAVQLKVP